MNVHVTYPMMKSLTGSMFMICILAAVIFWLVKKWFSRDTGY